MTEYWLDVFDDKPLEAHRNAEGFIQLRTDDPLINKWEEKIAEGEEPDLQEAFSQESWDQLHRIRAKAGKMKMQQGMTMKETMDRIDRDARLQGLDEPGRTVMGGPRTPINPFGDHGID